VTEIIGGARLTFFAVTAVIPGKIADSMVHVRRSSSMKKLALGALLTGLAAACGGGKVNLLDAGVDAPQACNPIRQTGCKANEKCTWIVDIDADPTAMPMKDEIGHAGCAPVGATPDGATCTDAAAATNGGADTCVAGDLCIAQKCKPICDPQLVAGAGAGACAADYSCSGYRGVFESGGAATAGVCEPACDPLTQRLKVGALEACGSADPAKPRSTCIPASGLKAFACAPTGPSLYGLTDRAVPLGDFPNACAPGFLPFYFEDASGAMKTLCSGMCAPLKMDKDIAMAAVNDPTHVNDNRGDRTALGKLPTDAMPGPMKSTCDVAVKGSAVMDLHGEDCRFLWFPLAQGDPTKALQSPYNDTLGICFAYEKFLTVTMPGMTQKFPEKSCADLPVDAPATDPYGSAKENGCYPLSQSLGFRKAAHRTPSYRLANGDGPMVRHVFD